ncbi:FG-GAP repeat domain-containing protein [Ruegeria atlantica]|uniref:FG-GAP repeat domain-containing protein n=1 Tax=Ruegeria atlantica TaxID=81569 RepID=UPI00147BE928|nr:VCBS repeat-containing protein [Ruegeria atlantica]
MIAKAPHLSVRLWQDRVRGALLALSLWLAGETPAVAETITSARFTEPTTRYAHGVLGDNIEYSALELTVQSDTLTIRLPSDRVFEDLAPRLIDIDLDGKLEVIVVESHNRTGAQLSIYDRGGKKIAATPHIGTRFRWLAPIGAADLDGDGYVEIAYIDRPHLAKTLRIWRYRDGDLTEVATLPGLTNHRIGEDFITGGVRDCGTGPELIVVSADWQQIASVSYEDGWTTRMLSSFTHKAVKQTLDCLR